MRKVSGPAKDPAVAWLPFDPDTVVSLLFGKLPAPLFDIIGRTMALEVNVARLQGVLTGDTPEARFHSFLRRLARHEPLAAPRLPRVEPR